MSTYARYYELNKVTCTVRISLARQTLLPKQGESSESCTRELYYAAVFGRTTLSTNCHVFVVHSLYTKLQSMHACLRGFVSRVH